MTREEAIEKIDSYFEWVNDESPIHVPQEVLNALCELKQPPTLCDFLGWEEGKEYEWRGDKYRIQSDIVQVYDKEDGMWFDSSEELNDYLRLRQAKKVEPKYYAKIKGWELVGNDICYFYKASDKKIYLTTARHAKHLTRTEWNELGIDDSNADFEEIEVE